MAVVAERRTSVISGRKGHGVARASGIDDESRMARARHRCVTVVARTVPVVDELSNGLPVGSSGDSCAHWCSDGRCPG
jgi:hypothetical protein